MCVSVYSEFWNISCILRKGVKWIHIYSHVSSVYQLYAVNIQFVPFRLFYLLDLRHQQRACMGFIVLFKFGHAVAS